MPVLAGNLHQLAEVFRLWLFLIAVEVSEQHRERSPDHSDGILSQIAFAVVDEAVRDHPAIGPEVKLLLVDRDALPSRHIVRKEQHRPFVTRGTFLRLPPLHRGPLDEKQPFFNSQLNFRRVSTGGFRGLECG